MVNHPMLRLCFARSSCPSLPTLTTWSRSNSTSNPRVDPDSSKVTTAAVPGSSLLDIRGKLRASAAVGEGQLLQDLVRELESTDADSGPSIKEPQKVAQSEGELFGSLSTLSQGGQLDPKTLPLRVPPDALQGEFTEEFYAASLVHGRGIHIPFFHPRTHDIPVANIQFRSHHPRLLDLYTHFATHAAYSLGIPVSRPVYLPTKRTLWTVLRGPFAHKKSQENFERRVHKRAIKAWDADAEVVDRWMKYLRRHALGGVGMRMTKWERLPLGLGASRLNASNREQEKRPMSSADRAVKIKTLGEKIMREEMGEVSQNS